MDDLKDRYLSVDLYEYNSFEIELLGKESTGEFIGILYNSYEPYVMIKTAKGNDAEDVMYILEDYADRLIDDE